MRHERSRPPKAMVRRPQPGPSVRSTFSLRRLASREEGQACKALRAASRRGSLRVASKGGTEREEAAAVEDEPPPKPSAGVGLVAWVGRGKELVVLALVA